MNSKLIDLGVLKVTSQRMRPQRPVFNPMLCCNPIENIDHLLDFTEKDFEESFLKPLTNFGDRFYVVEFLRELQRLFIYPYDNSYYSNEELSNFRNITDTMIFYIDIKDLLNLIT